MQINFNSESELSKLTWRIIKYLFLPSFFLAVASSPWLYNYYIYRTYKTKKNISKKKYEAWRHSGHRCQEELRSMLYSFSDEKKQPEKKLIRIDSGYIKKLCDIQGSLEYCYSRDESISNCLIHKHSGIERGLKFFRSDITSALFCLRMYRKEKADKAVNKYLNYLLDDRIKLLLALITRSTAHKKSTSIRRHKCAFCEKFDESDIVEISLGDGPTYSDYDDLWLYVSNNDQGTFDKIMSDYIVNIEENVEAHLAYKDWEWYANKSYKSYNERMPSFIKSFVPSPFR